MQIAGGARSHSLCVPGPVLFAGRPCTPGPRLSTNVPLSRRSLSPISPWLMAPVAPLPPPQPPLSVYGLGRIVKRGRERKRGEEAAEKDEKTGMKRKRTARCGAGL